MISNSDLSKAESWRMEYSSNQTPLKNEGDGRGWMNGEPSIRYGADGHKSAAEVCAQAPGVAPTALETASPHGQADGSLEDGTRPGAGQSERSCPAFLRHKWYMAAWATELGATGWLARTIADVPMLFVRTANRDIAALRDECPHRFAPLSMGKVGEDVIECGYHGISFDFQGKCVANPHGPCVSALQVERFAAKVAHQAIWVWLGEPEQADFAAIPNLDFIEATLPTAATHGYEPIAADYLLCTDNILDLSHADYLHPASLGGGATTRATSRVVAEGETVHIEWFAENDVAPPALAAALEHPENPVDVRISVDWQAPGVMVLHFGAAPAGRPENEGVGTVNVHVMTPEKGGRTHYFYWNSRNFRQHDAEFNEFVRGMLLHAFANEDKRMLEAQQARIGNVPFESRGPVLLRTDAGSTQVRRLMAKLIQSQGAG